MNKAKDYRVGDWFFVKGDRNELTLCLAATPLTQSKYNDGTVVWADGFHNKTMIAPEKNLRACTAERLGEYHTEYRNDPFEVWDWFNKRSTKK